MTVCDRCICTCTQTVECANKKILSIVPSFKEEKNILSKIPQLYRSPCLFTFLQLFVYITFWKKGWEIQNFPPLTSFIFRVWHKCLLHGFWCQNFVFFLNSGRCGGSYFLLGHHFESFNYGNIAESLGNWQSSLTILELKKKFPWNYNVFCRNVLSILTCLSLFWSCNSTTTDNAQWARKF